MAFSLFKDAIVPSTTNLAAFVVFPVFFAIVIIAYSIVDIKKVRSFRAFHGSAMQAVTIYLLPYLFMHLFCMLPMFTNCMLFYKPTC